MVRVLEKERAKRAGEVPARVVMHKAGTTKAGKGPSVGTGRRALRVQGKGWLKTKKKPPLISRHAFLGVPVGAK